MMDEFPPDQPPAALAVKKRLMVLFANDGRSWLEENKVPSPQVAAERADLVSGWLLSTLANAITDAERERHAKPFGTWTEREILDDSWDMQAAGPLRWALGLLDEPPRWDDNTVWGPEIDEFRGFPDPAEWRPDLTLVTQDEIEEQAKIHETCMWRIRCDLSVSREHEYVMRLLRRAEKLGHVRLAKDGDLALTDGGSIASLLPEDLHFLGSGVYERLKALNWLCGHDEDWDLVTGDTIVGWLWDDKWPNDPPPTKGGITGLLKRWFRSR